MSLVNEGFKRSPCGTGLHGSLQHFELTELYPFKMDFERSTQGGPMMCSSIGLYYAWVDYQLMKLCFL